MSQRRDEPHGTTRTALARTVQAGPMTPLSVHCSRIPGLGAGRVSVRPGRGSRLLAPGLWPCHVRTHWPVVMSPPGLLAHRKLSVNIRAWKFPVAAVTTHCELRGFETQKIILSGLEAKIKVPASGLVSPAGPRRRRSQACCTTSGPCWRSLVSPGWHRHHCPAIAWPFLGLPSGSVPQPSLPFRRGHADS